MFLDRAGVERGTRKEGSIIIEQVEAVTGTGQGEGYSF